jgi:hypothetical protein
MSNSSWNIKRQFVRQSARKTNASKDSPASLMAIDQNAGLNPAWKPLDAELDICILIYPLKYVLK